MLGKTNTNILEFFAVAIRLNLAKDFLQVLLSNGLCDKSKEKEHFVKSFVLCVRAVLIRSFPGLV